MKRVNQVVWGVILIAIGVLIGLKAFGVIDIDLFFDGWWTLIIIIPSVMGLFSGSDITGNIIGICVGVFLLLCCQDVLTFTMMWKLIIPVIIIIFGIKLIFGSCFDKKMSDAMKKLSNYSGNKSYGTAVFSGDKMIFNGETFEGAELNAIFGGIKCDLRNAIINQDCAIDATALFGGIDIFVPNNVNIKVSSTSLFGGVSNKVVSPYIEAVPTIYIKGTCMFGGVDIK